MKKRLLKKKQKYAQYYAQKKSELKIRKQRLYFLSKQLHSLKETIQLEKAKTLDERIREAKQAYSFEEYLMYSEPQYVPEGSPTYQKRLAEYNQEMQERTHQVLHGAYRARLFARKEYHKLGR